VRPGVYARHADFFKLFERNALIYPVAAGFGNAHGPVCSRAGFLLFSDVDGGRILKYTVPHWEPDGASGELTVLRSPSQSATGLTLDHQGRLLACERATRRVTRTEKDGGITVLADRYEGKPLVGPHDLVYNIDGSIYFTDALDSEAPAPNGSTSVSAVYRIAPDGKLSRVTTECQRATGIALGARQLDLYVADGGRNEVRVFPIADDGSLSPGTVFARMESDLPGAADGLKTDERGNVHAAGPGGVWVFSAGGGHLGTIVPPEQPTNLCWGRGFEGLYITTRTSVHFIPTVADFRSRRRMTPYAAALGTRTF